MQPTITNLISKGKVSYHESARAFNTIRLKKDILNLFPELLERSSRMSYEIEFFQNHQDLIKKLWQFQLEKKAPPLIISFKNEKQSY